MHINVFFPLYTQVYNQCTLSIVWASGVTVSPGCCNCKLLGRCSSADAERNRHFGGAIYLISDFQIA